MKIRLPLFIGFLFFPLLLAQAQTSKPKLAVGIVVDQMRMEYLYRFASSFGPNGFKRLMDEGFVCYNTQINYIPSVTGPGHASIYSGTTPKYHGICSNSWYDRETRKVIYCASDSLAETVGNPKKTKDSYSARNILLPNLGDAIKLATAKQGKIYSISLKDRAAAFSAGHAADGAFWFDRKTGNFVSSTYYMSNLPDWLTKFNQKRIPENYLDSTWKPFGKPEDYHLSFPQKDYMPYASGKGLDSLSNKTLRQTLKKGENSYNPIYNSPFGNKLLVDLAIDVIQNANIGNDSYPDLLAISFSSPDAIGHTYSPLSKEQNDDYMRLDRELARLLEALDKYIGKDNYVLFMTADHGMSDNPSLLMDNRIPGGYFNESKMLKEIKALLKKQHGEGKWLDTVVDDQIYLNHRLINEKNLNLIEMQNQVASLLRGNESVADAFTADQLVRYDYENALSARVQKGFNYRRGGDIRVIMLPGWMDISEKKNAAATHGSGFISDTNVPLIWYGANIPKGHSYLHYDITDIAPTVSALLHIMYPQATIGNPIPEILK